MCTVASFQVQSHIVEYGCPGGNKNTVGGERVWRGDKKHAHDHRNNRNDYQEANKIDVIRNKSLFVPKYEKKKDVDKIPLYDDDYDELITKLMNKFSLVDKKIWKMIIDEDYSTMLSDAYTDALNDIDETFVDSFDALNIDDDEKKDNNDDESSYLDSDDCYPNNNADDNLYDDDDESDDDDDSDESDDNDIPSE